MTWRRVRPAQHEEGFTLIEMVVAIALAGFVFAILAGVMTASLRTIAVQKSRTRANEIATQAIEDLQRYNFNSLGTCPASRAASPPTGMTDVVTLPNCPASVNSSFGDPCAAAPSATGSALIPKGTYTCFRSGVDPVRYDVRRYIAWADSARTAKRLAVFVDWTDQAGNHQVSQQSSLRAPDQGADIGIGPPTLTNPVITPISAGADSRLDLTSDPGPLAATEQLNVQIDSLNNSPGNATADRVYVAFRTLGPGNVPEQTTLFLNPINGGSRWIGSITAGNGFTFGAGTQILTFGIVRDSDGKSNTLIAPNPIELCPGSNCSGLPLPGIGGTTPSPVVADIGPGAGLLVSDVQFTVTTTHVTATDTLSVSFPTRTGVVSLLMNHNGSCVYNSGSATTTCTWTAKVPAAAGYTFDSASPQTWWITASQNVGPTPESRGSTTVRSISVTVA